MFNIQQLAGTAEIPLVYIMVEDHILRFEYSNRKAVHSFGSLDEVGSQLPDSFIRISRNLILNLNLVDNCNVDQRTVNIGDRIFPVSRRRMNSVRNALSQYAIV